MTNNALVSFNDFIDALKGAGVKRAKVIVLGNHSIEIRVPFFSILDSIHAVIPRTAVGTIATFKIMWFWECRKENFQLIDERPPAADTQKDIKRPT